MTFKNWDQILNLEMVKADGFTFHKAEFTDDIHMWRLFFKMKDGYIESWYLSDMPSKWFKTNFTLLDETVNLASRIQFIPKKITDLKAEGWNETEKNRLIKGPYWMGKKKQQLLGRLSTGVVSINKNMKLGIYFNNYFFTPEQIRFVLKPVFNKGAMSRIKSMASNLNETSWPEFFKNLHSMSLE